jgi:hypothetical protein
MKETGQAQPESDERQTQQKKMAEASEKMVGVSARLGSDHEDFRM